MEPLVKCIEASLAEYTEELVAAVIDFSYSENLEVDLLEHIQLLD